ncbi:MAG: RsmE family RNA methyltransferase [Phycisphaerales bacterium]
MSTHRIYFPDLAAYRASDSIMLVVEGDEGRHAATVKRVRAGELVELFDGAGRLARGLIDETRKRSVTVAVREWSDRDRERPEIVLLAPTPKGSRPESMIDQLVQVGVARWTPLLTKRSIVEPRANRVDRWRRTVIESSKQCGRSWLMEIDEPTSLDEAIARAPEPIWVGDSDGVVPPSRTTPLDSLTVIVGPEGGLTDEERDGLIERGATPVRLGPHVMRLECAAVVAAATAWRAAQ